MDRRRPILGAALAAVVLTAATGCSGSDSSGHVAVKLPSPSASGRHHDPADDQSGDDGGPDIHTMEVFYLGDGPRGSVLYRTPVLVVPGIGRIQAAVNGLLEQPDVPQYHSFWRPGWLAGASPSHGRIDVAADGAPVARPAGMDERTAEESVQQVVYTLQLASRSQDPIQFTRGGRPAATVLGVPTRHPVGAALLSHTLSLVNISDGTLDGTFLSRGRIPVRGLSNTAGGRLVLRVELDGKVVRTVPGRSSAWGYSHTLYPWRITLDTRGLPNGRYQVVVSGPDPTDPSLTFTDRRPLRLGGHH